MDEETKKQRLKREAEEWRLELRQEKIKQIKQRKAKQRIKWLSKMFDDGDFGLEQCLIDGFDDNDTAQDFLMDLIENGVVKKNALIALMDKKGFFDAGISQMEGDAHEEWWNGEARDEGFWPRNG